MLVVKSPNPKEKSRASIETVKKTLQKLLNKCNQEPEHAFRPAPWPRRKGDYKEEAVEAKVVKSSAEILERKNLRIHNGRTLTL